MMNRLVLMPLPFKLNPTYDWAINGKGIVLEQLERYDEALRRLQTRIRNQT